MVPFYPLTLTQIIYVLMFKDLDSQTALGKGRTDADSYTNTGTTNKKTFCYGSTDATDNVKFLGMEDYFGNRRWWIDGCYYDNNRNMLIGKGNFNDTGSGYENFGQVAPSDLSGYIDKVQGGNNTGLSLPPPTVVPPPIVIMAVFMPVGFLLSGCSVYSFGAAPSLCFLRLLFCAISAVGCFARNGKIL